MSAFRGLEFRMMLSVFVALFTVAASYKVEKTEAPNLLLDLYNSNVIERCDFQNLSSIAPIEVHPGRNRFLEDSSLRYFPEY